MTDQHGFHPAAFTTASTEPDARFYAGRPPGALMDAGARAAVTALYQTVLPEGAWVLDLMAGDDSHLPPDTSCEAVIGIGLDAAALDANPRLTQRIVQDLNEDPVLPLPDDSLDAVCLCDAAPYLRRPLEILAEAARVLRPGGIVVFTFAERLLPGKAVALWQALEGADRSRLLTILLGRAGFVFIDTGEVQPPVDDPAWLDAVYAVTARKPGAASIYSTND
ncbi:class I SAM-dependent methyltransferase [Gluconacetobacter tumulisoli]|uniref:Methyltransferase domain-containing protein n=1 Tax=Gluconacetobacter tumulisoli TaxID=1286189 RepID=A0A7W4PM79_9PROT|nr:methyltransferase domain-containing protein [Gluconacetobacter tumulisoli]MBB2201369.1 methyltransferase domain-containing protein [Gluconacetobacter tumulisoli]